MSKSWKDHILDRIQSKIQSKFSTSDEDFARGLDESLFTGMSFQRVHPDGRVENIPPEQVYLAVPESAEVYLGQFERDQLEAVAESLESWNTTIPVSVKDTFHDVRVETSTSYAARFIRAYLAFVMKK
jgi:hypothetical protein